MRATRTNIQTLIACWERFLVWYEGHKVFTLSALNAVSLFVFASFVFIVWATKSGESHAQQRVNSTKPRAGSTSVLVPEETPAAPREVKPPPPQTAPEPRKDARAAPRIGVREYQVEVRRARRVFVQGSTPPAPGGSPEAEDEDVERSDSNESATPRN